MTFCESYLGIKNEIFCWCTKQLVIDKLLAVLWTVIVATNNTSVHEVFRWLSHLLGKFMIKVNRCHDTRWSTLVRVVNGPLTLFKLAEILGVTLLPKKNRFELSENFSFPAFSLAKIDFSYLGKISYTSVFLVFRRFGITQKISKNWIFDPCFIINKNFI